MQNFAHDMLSNLNVFFSSPLRTTDSSQAPQAPQTSATRAHHSHVYLTTLNCSSPTHVSALCTFCRLPSHPCLSASRTRGCCRSPSTCPSQILAPPQHNLSLRKFTRSPARRSTKIRTSRAKSLGYPSRTSTFQPPYTMGGCRTRSSGRHGTYCGSKARGSSSHEQSDCESAPDVDRILQAEREKGVYFDRRRRVLVR